MALEAVKTPCFLRKTTLRACERNTDFTMIDNLALEVVTSVEADQVTPLMSKVYLRLLQAPTELLERERVLRFAGEIDREGKQVKAWTQLCRFLRVSSETANKALGWMHERGVIGYYAGKNGVGIRIFLNRAASSIRVLPVVAGEKNLSGGRASSGATAASEGETAFKDNFVVPDASDSDLVAPAPKSGAATDNTTVRQFPAPEQALFDSSQLAQQLLAGIELVLAGVIRREGQRGFERMRDWMERFGIPKATRVAVHEGYRVAARGDSRDEKRRRHEEWVNVGRSDVQPVAHRLDDVEVEIYAEMCVGLFREKGVFTETSLADLSAEAGGMILPEDAPRVREAIERLMSGESAVSAGAAAAAQPEPKENQEELYRQYLEGALAERLSLITADEWERMLEDERRLKMAEMPALETFKGTWLRKALEGWVIARLRKEINVVSYDEFLEGKR